MNPVKKRLQRHQKFAAEAAVVAAVGHEEELLRRRRGREELPGLRDGNQIVAVAVSDENRTDAGANPGETVELISHELPRGHERKFPQDDVGNRRERLAQSERSVRPTAGKVGRDTAAKGLPKDDHVLGRHPFDQPFIGGIGRGVTARFRR